MVLCGRMMTRTRDMCDIYFKPQPVTKRCLTIAILPI